MADYPPPFDVSSDDMGTNGSTLPAIISRKASKQRSGRARLVRPGIWINPRVPLRPQDYLPDPELTVHEVPEVLAAVQDYLDVPPAAAIDPWDHMAWAAGYAANQRQRPGGPPFGPENAHLVVNRLMLRRKYSNSPRSATDPRNANTYMREAVDNYPWEEGRNAWLRQIAAPARALERNPQLIAHALGRLPWHEGPEGREWRRNRLNPNRRVTPLAGMGEPVPVNRRRRRTSSAGEDDGRASKRYQGTESSGSGFSKKKISKKRK